MPSICLRKALVGHATRIAPNSQANANAYREQLRCVTNSATKFVDFQFVPWAPSFLFASLFFPLLSCFFILRLKPR